ncbi:MAG: hypothetical protein U0T83_00895 [Bacteriovoracaceae bacterium]
MELNSSNENWFFYWQTSASLWKQKLEELKNINPILIPVYWAYHSENGETYDFAVERPETNFKLLFEIATSLNKELIFLVPVNSAPFLPNGGIPAVLAKMPAVNYEGIQYGIADSEGRINKLYSFYDPRVYQMYRKFVWELGQYFNLQGITSDIVGMRSGYLENGKFHSYLEDTSRGYEQGFAKFLSVKEKEGSLSDGLALKSVEEELKLKNEYNSMIENLYFESARENLSGNWTGMVNVAFLNGSTKNIIENKYSQDNLKIYHSTLMAMEHQLLPTGLLINSEIKQGILSIFLNDLIDNTFLFKKLKPSIYESDYVESLQPLQLFILIQLPSAGFAQPRPAFLDCGLIQHIHEQYKYMVRFEEDFSFLQAEQISPNRIYFISGAELDLSNFNKVIKLFLGGAKIVLDKLNINPQIEKKLELFFLENNLKREKVNFVTLVNVAQLGDNFFVDFNSDKLSSMEYSIEQKNEFWDKILHFLKIHHLSVACEEGVTYFWKYRSPTSQELNYTDVRRIYIYNPTSYKKRVKIKNINNFNLMKINREYNAKLKSQPNLIEIELLPLGQMLIDFGHYE